jgi:hypothetical protein
MTEIKKSPVAGFYSLPRGRSHIRLGPATLKFSKISTLTKYSHVTPRWNQNLMVSDLKLVLRRNNIPTKNVEAIYTVKICKILLKPGKTT